MSSREKRAPTLALVRGDVSSGSTQIARTTAELISRTAQDADVRTSEELVETVTSVTLAALGAQPAMAPLVALAREVLGVLDAAAPLDMNLDRVARAANGFVTDLDRRTATLAKRAAALVPSTRAVLTVSASSAVETTLLEVAKTRPVHAICLESRPINEGRHMAAALAKGGVKVTLAVDAALESVIFACGSVLLGADSIGDKGVVNKIGSAAAAHAARRHGIPVYVVADSSKLLPRRFPQPVDDDRPAEDVWPDHGPVQVWNRYFEAVPTALINKVITEGGALDPHAVDMARAALSVPPALREWAASRS